MPNTPKILVAALAVSLGCVTPGLANGPRERAVAAQDRGDLRAAQLEWRNAVRAAPDQGAARAGLAAISLDLGDMDTAEREARAAMQRGFDPAAGTALLVRVYLSQGKARELLTDLPEPDRSAPPAVAAQVAAGRALAQLVLGEREAARHSVALAMRLDGAAVEPALAAAALAREDGDLAASEAHVDRVLRTNPTMAGALMRKGMLQLERGDVAGSLDSLGRIVSRAPADVAARLRRAEVLLRTGAPDRARTDVDAVLTAMPNNAIGLYLRAILLAGQRDWRGTDTVLQRLGPQIGNFPDGLLLMATAKRGLGQSAQAEDAARRHVARWPEELRGAKLLAAIEMEAGRPSDAAAVLRRASANGLNDAEFFDMLGRAEASAGRPAAAATALEQAARLSPANADFRARLAMARLMAGDVATAQDDARQAMRLAPGQPGMREMLVVSALARGDLDGAAAELERMDPATRRGEVAGLLDGTLRLVRIDLPGARSRFEETLRQFPNNVAARMGLARVEMLQGRTEQAVTQLGQALQREPAQAEASQRLAAIALSDAPSAPAARAALSTAQAAHPAEVQLALTLAQVLARQQDFVTAVALLQTPALRQQRGAAVPLARSEVHLLAGELPQAETAAREALAEEPGSVNARRQLAMLLLRGGNARVAEATLREGLRASPTDTALLQSLLGLQLQSQGPEAALAEASRIGAAAGATPAMASMRGDLLLSMRRPQEAAEAYNELLSRAPSAPLALRLATALRAAGRPDEAAAALSRWMEAAGDDMAAQAILAQLDIVAERLVEAEARLRRIAAQAPEDATTLNNLAWVLGQQGGPDRLAEARQLAQRAYYLQPSPEAADTLGWILAQAGDTRLALPLLRQAATGARDTPNLGGISYRLAHTLNAAGQRQEAVGVLTPLLASSTAFAERAEAERLLRQLQH